MGYCTKCGNKLDPDLRFCPSCGTEVGAQDSAEGPGGGGESGAGQGVSVTGAGGTPVAPGTANRFGSPAVIIIANVAAVLLIASLALGAYFIFRGDDGGTGDTSAGGKTTQGTSSTRTGTSTTPTTTTRTTTSGLRNLTIPVPTPAPTPTPAPVPATPAPPNNTDLEAIETQAMLDVILADPYYGGGDSYSVISYDALSNTGTVLIIYYGDVTSYTELYMAKDQYGWYVYDETSFT